MDATVLQWITGLALIVIELAITTIVGLVIKSKWDKRQKEKEELERLREEQRINAENARCNVVKDTIHNEIIQLEKDLTTKSVERYNDLKQDIGGVKDDIFLVKKGLQNDLYIDLVHLHDVYVDRGYATRDNKRDYDTLYWNYHNLGKNGIADGMHEKVMALPESPKGDN